MFKHVSIAALLLITAPSFSQITVVSSDMPNAGDSIHVSLTGTTAPTDYTLTGAGFTWDFSTLTPNAQMDEIFDNPLTFTTPFNLLFNPLNTSYGKDNYAITTIPIPGVTITSAYDFIKESSTSLRQIGAGYTIGGIPLPFLYSAKDYIYRFPMSYLNTDSCDYAFGLPIPSIGYYGQTGHRVNVVDGWGNIATPYGSFNALRIVSTVAAYDTTYLDTLGFGIKTPRPLTRAYKWLATGMKIPVLEVDVNVIGGIETISNILYIDSVRTGVPQVGIAENSNDANLNVYPNPATDLLSIQYNLTAASKVKISITDLLGQTLAVVEEKNEAAGKQVATINLKDLNLSNGIYFVNLQSNNKREVRKIVVGK